ncbi:MAG TPA: TetR/AcrR family transcriptional regulator [Pyrinomonadaceae bacterium]|jgi:AcrR family transcriptional regulator
MVSAITREEVREAILDATDQLLARYGYRKMTMDDIAQEVGIGKGTIYLHFASKEEVTLSHVDRIVERLKERLWAIARTDADVAIRLRLMLVARVLFRFDSVQHYTQSLNDLLAALRPKLLARRARYFEEEARVFAEVLNEGGRAGVFNAGDALSTAFTLLHATNSLLPYSLSTTELGERDEIKEKTEHIADLILSGLLRKPDAPAPPRRRRR